MSTISIDMRAEVKDRGATSMTSHTEDKDAAFDDGTGNDARNDAGSAADNENEDQWDKTNETVF